jgi:hypothetical protein
LLSVLVAQVELHPVTTQVLTEQTLGFLLQALEQIRFLGHLVVVLVQQSIQEDKVEVLAEVLAENLLLIIMD